MLTQSGYHKRLKTAQPLLCKAILTLAACCPSWFDDLWITDATPVPCGMSRETVQRSDLAGHASYGHCASHSRWYWGLKLYLVCTGDGMPIMWCGNTDPAPMSVRRRQRSRMCGSDPDTVQRQSELHR